MFPGALPVGRLGVEARDVQIAPRYDRDAVGAGEYDGRIGVRLPDGGLYAEDAAVAPDLVDARDVLIGGAPAERQYEQHLGVEIDRDVAKQDAGPGAFVTDDVLQGAGVVRVGADELVEDGQCFSVGGHGVGVMVFVTAGCRSEGEQDGQGRAGHLRGTARLPGTSSRVVHGGMLGT